MKICAIFLNFFKIITKKIELKENNCGQICKRKKKVRTKFVTQFKIWAKCGHM